MEKKSKNNIQWKRGSNSIGSPDKVHSLQYEQSSLLDKEQQLDRLLSDIKSFTNDELEVNAKYTYITSQDLNTLELGHDQIVMVVKAPSEAKLMVPEDNPLDLHLVSESDEITIFEVQSGETTNSSQASGGVSSVENLKPIKTEPITPSRKFKLPVRPGTTGSAQRNLCKEFDDVNGSGTGSERKMTRLMGKSLFNDFGENLKVGTLKEEPDSYLLERSFKSNITSEDLSVLVDPSNDSPSKYLYGTGLFANIGNSAVHRDVKLFSPQKLMAASEEAGKCNAFLIPDINLSPVYDIPGIDSKLFPWEPLTDYNFTLTDSEGVLDLFDYK